MQKPPSCLSLIRLSHAPISRTVCACLCVRRNRLCGSYVLSRYFFPLSFFLPPPSTETYPLISFALTRRVRCYLGSASLSFPSWMHSQSSVVAIAFSRSHLIARVTPSSRNVGSLFCFLSVHSSKLLHRRWAELRFNCICIYSTLV